MYATWRQTGYWTGTDRSSERQLPEAVRHWADLTGFGANVRLTAKTVLVDAFSPTEYAAHSVVTAPYRPSPWEWTGAALLVACVALAAAAVWGRPVRPRSATVLTAVFLAAYVAATVAVWTFGNNDPIYTRFLYPAYPLAWILSFAAYRAVASTGPPRWRLLPFWLLAALFVGVQAWRGWTAPVLPVRYFS
jgi:hypothetical protein